MADGIMLTTVKYMERHKKQKAVMTETTLYIGVQGRRAALKHFAELATTIDKERWTQGYRGVRIIEPHVDNSGMVRNFPDAGGLNLFYDTQTQGPIPEVAE